jgi:hypothetical protein
MTGESSMTEMLELMQKMWNPLNIPLPTMMTPTLNPAEVEKKIADLKAVESWLAMNLNMLQMTIQTLEMQKSGLEAIRSSAEAMRTSAEAMKTAGSTPPPQSEP